MASASSRGGTGLLLTWHPVAAADLLGYHVYRAVGEGNLERLTAAPVGPAPPAVKPEQG